MKVVTPIKIRPLRIIITEEDDDVFVVFDDGIHQLVRQFFNRVAGFLFNQPIEDRLLLAQVTLKPFNRLIQIDSIHHLSHTDRVQNRRNTSPIRQSNQHISQSFCWSSFVLDTVRVLSERWRRAPVCPHRPEAIEPASNKFRTMLMVIVA